MKMPRGQGLLPLCTEKISSLGGRLLALTSWTPEEPGATIVTAKIAGVDRKALTEGLAGLDVEFVDVRET